MALRPGGSVGRESNLPGLIYSGTGFEIPTDANHENGMRPVPEFRCLYPNYLYRPSDIRTRHGKSPFYPPQHPPKPKLMLSRDHAD